ncbi:MAG: chloramphenicol acetyltransferase [Clostridia bacterium]
MVQTKCLGEKPLIHEGVKYRKVEFGIFTEVGANTALSNTKFDDFSYCGHLCIFQNVEIKKFSSIAAMVRIGATDHPMWRPTQHHFTYRKKKYGFANEDDKDFFKWREKQVSVIGNDTWIGHGALISPNVKIGDGAVIGQGAVVTRNVPPYAIAVGVPARVIRFRFSKEVIDKLKKIKWWDWDYELIKERIDDFSIPIEEFVSKYYEV